jgi:hypothetical protein
MTAFVVSTPWETERIAAIIEAGEFLAPCVHRIAIISTDSADGSIIVRHMTNDDDDDGIADGQWTTWAEGYDSLELALKHQGKCRIGISGVIVTVTLDGVEQR